MSKADHERAESEKQARQRLRLRGLDAVVARPWRPAPLPPSDVEFLEFAAWRGNELDHDDLRAALTLLPAAHAELDALEAGLLFSARSAGITWVEIAEAIGLRSAQAAHQRAGRRGARGLS